MSDKELEKALAKLAADHAGPTSLESAKERILSSQPFPIIRRRFHQRSPWALPLRRNIDYQSGSAKVFIFCDECGGIIDKEDDHLLDPEACKLEKVRQVMDA